MWEWKTGSTVSRIMNRTRHEPILGQGQKITKTRDVYTYPTES